MKLLPACWGLQTSIRNFRVYLHDPSQDPKAFVRYFSLSLNNTLRDKPSTKGKEKAYTSKLESPFGGYEPRPFG